MIVGTGGLARSLLSSLRKIPYYDVVGLIEIGDEGETEIDGHAVFSKNTDVKSLIESKKVQSFFIAVGDNLFRLKEFRKYSELGLEPATIIDPDATVSEHVHIGKGVYIGLRSIICNNTNIGDNTIVNTGALIEHMAEVGNHCHICPGALVAGRVKIKEGAFLGIGATVIQKVEIGENTVIGGGSVVVRNLEPNVVAAGSPVKVLKHVAPNVEFGEHQAYEIK